MGSGTVAPEISHRHDVQGHTTTGEGARIYRVQTQRSLGIGWVREMVQRERAGPEVQSMAIRG